jgi:hypothetical protein
MPEEKDVREGYELVKPFKQQFPFFWSVKMYVDKFPFETRELHFSFLEYLTFF